MRMLSLNHYCKTFLVLAFLGVSACRSSAPPPPQLVVRGAPDLNAGGNAAIVRVYQLTNDTNFEGATLETFWRDDAGALGDELISSQNVLLYPNQVETFELDLDENTRFIGVAVDLREPELDSWRAIYPATDLEKRRLSVTIGRNELMLDVQ